MISISVFRCRKHGYSVAKKIEFRFDTDEVLVNYLLFLNKLKVFGKVLGRAGEVK